METNNIAKQLMELLRLGSIIKLELERPNIVGEHSLNIFILL